MTLDIAMGGSTNTVLHLLAAAHEAGVDFTMNDIDRLSRKVPVLCKVAPAKQDVHMEDVHRAGGIMSILGELDRAGLLDTSVPTVHEATLKMPWINGTLSVLKMKKCIPSLNQHRAVYQHKPHSHKTATTHV